MLSEWMWEAALAQEQRGYTYYTKVRINNCVDYGSNEFGRDPYLLLFRNIHAASYRKLERLPEVRIQAPAGSGRARARPPG